MCLVRDGRGEATGRADRNRDHEGSWVGTDLSCQGHCDREHDGHRCGVVEQFGHDHAEAIDDDQGAQGAESLGDRENRFRDEFRRACLGHGLGDAEAGSDHDQDRPRYAFSSLGRADTARPQQDAHCDESRQGNRDQFETDNDHHRCHHREREARPLEAGLFAAREVARQVEIGTVPIVLHEIGRRLQQKGVSGLQYDFADLAGNPLGIAMHRDDDRVVGGAKVGIPDALAHQGRRRGNHRFHQSMTVIRLGAVPGFLVGEWHESANALQVDNGRDHPGKDQMVPGFDHNLGPYGGDDPVIAPNLYQEQAGQAAESSAFDGCTHEIAVGLDHHGGHVFSPAFAEVVGCQRPVGEQTGADGDQV